MSDRGFTLIEVLAALFILSFSLVVLLDSQSRSMDLVGRARSLDSAVELAESRMTELVAISNTKGVSALKDEEEGEFDQERFPGYRWRYRTSKVPTPNFAALLGAVTGGSETEASEGASNASLFQGPLQQIGKVWGEALRELRVEVLWKDGHREKEYELVTHLIAPDALGKIQGVIAGLGQLAGGNSQ